jgi:hypothetical protein
MRKSILFFVLAAAFGAAGCLPPQSAFFVFSDSRGDEFVIELSDAQKIAHARRLLSGQTTEQPSVMGVIEKSTAPYNTEWNFHLVPDSIEFFDFAVEVCDAGIQYVEDNLDDAGGAFLPGLQWCPWSSHLVREI